MSLIFLRIGIVLIPFCELLAKMFPYTVSAAPDTRVAKIALGVWIALAIGLIAFFSGEIRRCKNQWLLLFIVYIPLSIHLSPQFNIQLNGITTNNYWVWQPFCHLLCFFLMFMAVQSVRVSKKEFNDLLNLMVLCGFVMAIYMIIQGLGYDQFFIKKDGKEFWQVTQPGVVGNLGNSTVVAAYVGMMVPMAVYLKRYVKAGVIVLAVLVSQSVMAIVALLTVVSIYLIINFKKCACIFIALILMVIIAIGSWANYLYPDGYASFCKETFTANGRFVVWKEVHRVIKDEKIGEGGLTYPFTGTGIGSYPIVVKPIIKTHFAQVHNEYLEIFSNFGMVGLGLFLMALWFMIKQAWGGVNKPEILTLGLSFLFIAIVAVGSFPWQLSPHNFYTVIIVGLLHNRNLLKGEF